MVEISGGRSIANVSEIYSIEAQMIRLIKRKKYHIYSYMKDQIKIIIVKLLGYFLTPICLIIVGLLLVVSHPIQVICRNIWGYGAHKKSVDVISFLIIKSLLILGVTISFNCFEKLPKGRSMILISNHQSLFDIPPIIWGFRNQSPKIYFLRSSWERTYQVSLIV